MTAVADGSNRVDGYLHARTTREADMYERPRGSRRLLPALGVFAGGLVNALLPTGAFGTHDLAARAVITGAVSGVAAVLIFMLINRRVTR